MCNGHNCSVFIYFVNLFRFCNLVNKFLMRRSYFVRDNTRTVGLFNYLISNYVESKKMRSESKYVDNTH